ncbi:hypothetical protein RY27_11840 [Litorilinea aerophila]|nr:hypothetical protein RY27_11840 [Litorilinea aerophila]GIV82448.1 MAG: hypothetical protein KatS3mg051_1802 [Anaerolineae bacterium]
MKKEQGWTVRLERRPHRDAVRRLRKAYELLWQMPRSGAPSAASDSPIERTKLLVQEVQK